MAFKQEETLALPGIRAVKHPISSGKIQVLTQAGPWKASIKAADDLGRATDAMARTMPELDDLVKESDTATTVLGMLSKQLGDATQNARLAHDSTQEGGTFPVKVHGTKNAVGFATKHVEEDWFDTGGKMDQLKAKVDDGHILDANLVAKNWLKRMDKWSPISIDATSPEANPAFRAAKIQVQQIAQVTDKMLGTPQGGGGGRSTEQGKSGRATPRSRDKMHENDVPKPGDEAG